MRRGGVAVVRGAQVGDRGPRATADAAGKAGKAAAVAAGRAVAVAAGRAAAAVAAARRAQRSTTGRFAIEAAIASDGYSKSLRLPLL